MAVKITDEYIEEKLLELLEEEGRYLSIRETAKLLAQRYKIIKSPQVIKKYLEKLEKIGKITRRE